MNEVTRGAYRHRIPDGEDGKHTLVDEWCPCAPRVVQLPIAVAEREGYLRVVEHVSLAMRRAGRPA